MIYDSLSGYAVQDLQTGQYVRGLKSADTVTGLLVYYQAGSNCWERYRRADGLWSITRRLTSKVCPFDVVDPVSGAVVDKARP